MWILLYLHLLCCSRQTQEQMSTWWMGRLSISSLTAKCWSLHPSGWRIMEIQQWKCWECFMLFSDGRTGFINSYSMWQTVTDPQTCCQGMLVTLWVFSNLATQWRGHQVHNNIWRQNHRFIKRWKEVVGNCPMIPRNSQFHRVSWKIALWWSRTFFTCTLMFLLG